MTIEFDLWKKVSFYVKTPEGVTTLPDMFEPVAGRWKVKDTVDYDISDYLSDYQRIKDKVLKIEKLLLHDKATDDSQAMPE